MNTSVHYALTRSLRGSSIRFSIMMIASQNFCIVIIGNIVIQKVIFEKNLKLVLNIDYLFCIPSIYWKLIRYLFNSIDSNYRYCHQWTIAARYSSASPFKISKTFFSNLNPTIHETRINASLVLGNLSLEQYFIIGILQINLIILRKRLLDLFKARTSICPMITRNHNFNFFFNLLCLSPSLILKIQISCQPARIWAPFNLI